MNLETFLGGRVIVKVGDITEEETQSIVNAANSTLLGGGGVDGAIHEAGGPEILAECQKLRKRRYPNGLPTGDAVITSGGMLPASFVIHTVGPIYGQNQGRDAELLAASYRNSLELASNHLLRSIAFPSISTGAFNYPRNEAAAVSSEAISKFTETDSTIDTIHLVFFSRQDAETYLKNHRF